MRTIVYVDGFNLYYGSLKDRPGVRWLNLLALAERLLPENTIVGVNYFTAPVRPRPGKTGQADRQRLYLRALETIPNLTVYYGVYLARKKRRPLVNPQPGLTRQWPATALFHDSEEKGSDVNLATRLLVDGHADRFEAAAIISNDGDLKMPVEVVRQELDLSVTIINPHDRRRSAALSPRSLPPHAHYIQLRQVDLRASQFPDTLTTASKRQLTKPGGW